MRLWSKGPRLWAEAHGEPYRMSFKAARLGGCSIPDTGVLTNRQENFFWRNKPTDLAENKETT